MKSIDTQYITDYVKQVKKLVIIGLCASTVFGFSLPVSADERLLEQARQHLDKRNFNQAEALYEQLTHMQNFKTQGHYGLAEVAYAQQQLDEAEDAIEEVLKLNDSNPQYFYLAARIAGKQAQSASIFSKLGYAKETKKYFLSALEIDKKHKPSLIGLINFHQQAPAMAGGDKDEIAKLLNRLRAIDPASAFQIEAPILLSQNQIEQVFGLYKALLKNRPDSEAAQLTFDFAMMLSSHSHYGSALNELASIKVPDECQLSSFYPMRLYQIGKLSAESNTHLALGLKSMKQYASLPKSLRTINDEWVAFRIVQLEFLSGQRANSLSSLKKMRRATSDKDLKKKIKSLLKQHQ